MCVCPPHPHYIYIVRLHPDSVVKSCPQKPRCCTFFEAPNFVVILLTGTDNAESCILFSPIFPFSSSPKIEWLLRWDEEKFFLLNQYQLRPFFLQSWVLNPGPCACQASAPPLDHIPSPYLRSQRQIFQSTCNRTYFLFRINSELS